VKDYLKVLYFPRDNIYLTVPETSHPFWTYPVESSFPYVFWIIVIWRIVSPESEEGINLLPSGFHCWTP
jgi:hypothetical protein